MHETTANPGIAYDEVQKHKSEDDCWVIIDGMVYDLTDFLQKHPGGADAILAMAGQDASSMFTMMHPPTALGTLPANHCLGPVDESTMPAVEEEALLSEADLQRQKSRDAMPAAEDMLLLDDFEVWAEKVLSEMAWAYYRSAADSEATFHENRNAVERYFFRPRVLRDMSHGSTATEVLGIPVSMPVMIAPAAMAKLGHPLGEVNMTKAAGTQGVIQIISANASCSVEELFEARIDGQPLFFQIYLDKNRENSKELLRKVEKLGASAIVFTVDVMQQTKRTLDVRTKTIANPSPKTPKAAAPAPAMAGVSASISGYQDFGLTWGDVDFIRENTTLPIIVKGVQSVEDVELCVKSKVQGVILSNHGGRQADYAPAPIDILYELRVLRPDLFDKVEIMVDGGFRSGADVVKALALGAKAVGLGRPFLYANGTHGEDGVSRVFRIMHQEITNTMRNIGANTIRDLKPEMVGPAGPWVGRNRPAYLP
ncbi:mitochondrial fmn-dependent dehydrogenase [Plectosphaerella plurivora]|uniref:L-lactate dehydrogenase (cytochrome) n=1 Tax=Plectosphaerella plurivora TaxID=936078 RepID=A0A9P8V7F6_9PEZI|nr:mitochondrial fmn-dependent dehydrogenase [Plectosphaerella plurivora]